MASSSQGLNTEEVRNEVAQTVLSYVQGVVPPGSAIAHLTLETPLHELGVDSVSVMEAINRIEEHYGMRFREEWLYDLENCGDVVECIVAAMGQREPNLKSPARPAAAGREAGAAVAAEGPAVPAVPTAEIPEASYDVAQFPECVAFGERLAMAAMVGLKNPFFRVNQAVTPPTAVINGQTVIRYTSFDYLGLSGHPQVRAAAKEAIDRFGTSASASRLVGGEHALLDELDKELASFLGTEAAIILPSGYGTNASVIGHLFGAEDLILYDELAHNSIAQGTALCKAKHRTFRHNDFAALDRLLADVRGQYRRVLVALEGVYSMDGDYPDLPRFIEVKKRHKALLYVDEAHSLGVMGHGGRGLCEHFGVDPGEGDLWMGTISKALASHGGYLAGREKLIRYLKYSTPSLVFATSTAPPCAAASLAALRVIRSEPQRVAQLRDRAALFLKLARQHRMNTGHSQDTAVIPIILGDSARCIQVSGELLERGIDAQSILYPAVRESMARVRFFINALHTEEQIQRTVTVLAERIAAGG